MPYHLVDLEVPAFDHLPRVRCECEKSKCWRRRTLSSPHENRYGCLGETAKPRTVEMWPVNDNLSAPDAKSQILMTRSPAPVANHVFPGSTATLRTQPKWPEMTRTSFHGG